jgi:hypothetical protein
MHKQQQQILQAYISGFIASSNIKVLCGGDV